MAEPGVDELPQAEEQAQRRRICGKQSAAALAATPVGWEELLDPVTGRAYYYCRATGESTWQKPAHAPDDASDEEQSAGEDWRTVFQSTAL